tara:strand:- start:831 stop:980 length:150 start_codon:yes stop_codon:yes gene_type:complete
MKLIALLVTIIGIVLLLPLIGVTALGAAADWIIALSVLIIGVGKLLGKI